MSETEKQLFEEIALINTKLEFLLSACDSLRSTCKNTIEMHTMALNWLIEMRDEVQKISKRQVSSNEK